LHRLLTIEASPCGSPVAAVRIDDAVFRNVPNPQMERHLRISKVVIEPAVRFDQHILHNIARIEPLPQFRVEPHIDHSPERGEMSLQELTDSIRVAIARGKQQRLSLCGFRPHLMTLGKNEK